MIAELVNFITSAGEGPCNSSTGLYTVCHAQKVLLKRQAIRHASGNQTQRLSNSDAKHNYAIMPAQTFKEPGVL